MPGAGKLTDAVAEVLPFDRPLLVTVCMTVPCVYGFVSGVVDILKVMPKVTPISERPLTVSVVGLPTQGGLGLAVIEVIVGQMSQPPGPTSVKVRLTVQPLAAVTTTL